LRGSQKDQAEIFAKALGAGGAPASMTQNEVRALQERPSHPDGNKLYGPSGQNKDGQNEPAPAA
jgi:hypothetical protein